MKHTPKPWYKVEDKLTQQYYITHPYGETIFHIAHVTKEDVGYGISEEEYHANASLIAAAPELLEACKGLIGILILKQYSKQFPNIYRKAKSAIAKAEGRE